MAERRRGRADVRGNGEDRADQFPFLCSWFPCNRIEFEYQPGSFALSKLTPNNPTGAQAAGLIAKYRTVDQLLATVVDFPCPGGCKCRLGGFSPWTPFQTIPVAGIEVTVRGRKFTLDGTVQGRARGAGGICQ
jgi:hypothetical protein